jgi:hypothetical protein
MAEEHDEEDDYVWESYACLSCHPDGTEGDDKSPGGSIFNKSY